MPIADRKFFKAWRDLGSLPREIWILFFSNLVNRMGTMALPFLVLYLTDSLGYSPTQAGLMMTCYGVGALFIAPVAGFLSDKFGPIQIMRSALFLNGLVLLLYPWAKEFYSILFVTILFAFTNEIYRPANLAAIGERVAPAHRKSAFALNRLSNNLGMSVGPVLGSVLAKFSYKSIFIVDGCTNLLAAIILIISTFQLHSHESEHASRPGVDSVYSDRRFLYFLAALLPVCIVFFQYECTLPLYLEHDLHLPVSDYGWLFTVNTVLIILFEIQLNSVISHWPFRRTLTFGASLFAIGFGTLYFAYDFWSTAATVMIWSFGEMILFPAMAAYVTEIASPSQRGKYMGIYVTAFNLAFVIAPWAGTSVFQHLGSNALWIGSFFVGILSTFLFSRLRHH